MLDRLSVMCDNNLYLRFKINVGRRMKYTFNPKLLLFVPVPPADDDDDEADESGDHAG